MNEFYMQDNELISEKKWIEEINRLQTSENADVKEELKNAIIDAVKIRAPDEHFGIFFSGGVDSSLIALICKKLKRSFTCYTVGFKTEEMETPEDILWAEKVAHSLGLKLEKKIFDMNEVEKIIKSVASIVPVKDVVSIGVGSVVYAVKELAKDHVFFSGLGSEEIFAGYQRHEEAKDVQQECWSGLKGMWKRDLLRDVSLAKHLKIDVKTPFLDKDVIKLAMQIPAEKKLDKQSKKIILREIAEELGLPKEFSWRKKKAAQYGSKFDRAIARLAKKAGFEFKADYIKRL